MIPKIQDVVNLVRVRQWFKNGLVFVPLVFSGNLTTFSLLPPVLLTFAGFSLLASATYCVNDVMDRDRDRYHPRKKNRPVASGKISVLQASSLAIMLVLLGTILLAIVNAPTLLIGFGYLGLQVAYNAGLKQIVIWDAILVSVGLVLRAIAGTTAIHVGAPTTWLLVCTFLLALYLSFAKRRGEFVLLRPEESAAHRASLGQYTIEFLNQAMTVSMALILTTYSLYTFFGTTPWMMVTIPFAFFGIFRFSLLQANGQIGDAVEAIIRDKPTMINVGIWLLLSIAALAGLLADFYNFIEGVSW